MVGRVLSYREGNFSGSMLNFGRVPLRSRYVLRKEIPFLQSNEMAMVIETINPTRSGGVDWFLGYILILLMEDILYHPTSMKPWNNGIFTISTGERRISEPSTVPICPSVFLSIRPFPSSVKSTMGHLLKWCFGNFRVRHVLCIKLYENLPSTELTYPTWGSLENHGLKSAKRYGIC